MHWGQNKLLLKNPVLIDGITRSGKSLLSGIISSLYNSEKIKFYTYFEHIIPALYFKKVDINYAKTQVRLELNELAYNTYLGRNVNLRDNEQTSVNAGLHKKIYLSRLKKEEGNKVIDRLLNTKNFFPFQTHELMPNIKYLNFLEINHKIIEIYRNPIDNIYSWIKLKWGLRFSEDERSFTLNKYNQKFKKNYPWFCEDYSNYWFTLNEYEKSAFSVCDLIDRSVKSQKRNPMKSKILTLSFENIYKYPQENLSKICKFLKTRQTNFTRSEIKKAKCPRKENLDDRKKKEFFIKENVSKKIFDKIKILEKSYNKNLYGL